MSWLRLRFCCFSVVGIIFYSTYHMVDSTAQSARVLCFGEALFDSIASPRCNGWTLEQVSINGEWADYPGGAPANVACALSRLGVSCAFAGALGDDKDGEALLNLFQSLGVSTQLTQLTTQHPTRKVMVTRANDGDRIFAGFVDGKQSFDFADCYFETPNGVDDLHDAVSSAIVVGTLGLAQGSTVQSMNSLASKVKKRPAGVKGPLLVVDVNWRDKFWPSSTVAEEDLARTTIKSFIADADIVKLTDQEAKWLYNVDPAEALANPAVLFEALKVKSAVLVTGGELGASYYIKDIGSGYQEAFQVKVEETTGAGDAFTAGFLASLLSDFDRHADKKALFSSKKAADEALNMASAAGALTCCKPGAIAAQPSMDQVQALMKTRI